MNTILRKYYSKGSKCHHQLSFVQLKPMKAESRKPSKPYLKTYLKKTRPLAARLTKNQAKL
jgi:hypothetical protein